MTGIGQRFNPLQRLLHWLMAFCILAMLFIGVGMVSSVAPKYLPLVAIHIPKTGTVSRKERDDLKAFGQERGLRVFDDLKRLDRDYAAAMEKVRERVKPAEDGSIIADGAVTIRDLNRALNWDLPDDEAVTVAGLLIHEVRRIPDTGQSFTFHGHRFAVLKRFPYSAIYQVQPGRAYVVAVAHSSRSEGYWQSRI